MIHGRKMDAITNAIYDSCDPKIAPSVGIQEIDGKYIIVVDIPFGMQRPYCLKSQGMLDGVYLRVAGTTRKALGKNVQFKVDILKCWIRIRLQDIKNMFRTGHNLSFANSQRIIPPFFQRFIFIAVIVGLRPVEMKFQRAGKLIKLNHE